MNISNLPREIVHRIVINGLTMHWKPITRPLMIVGFPYPNKERSIEIPQMRYSNPVELAKLLDCASICPEWANHIIDKDFWHHPAAASYLRLLPNPWELGSRWNKLFNEIYPVYIEFSWQIDAVRLEKSINRCIQQGRTSFRISVVLPFPEVIHNFENIWNVICASICTKCTYLRIDNGSRRIASTKPDCDIGFIPVAMNSWPELKELHLESVSGLPKTESFSDAMQNVIRLLNDAQHPVPFPGLKIINFQSSIEEIQGSLVPTKAPNIEICNVSFLNVGRFNISQWIDFREREVRKCYFKNLEKFRVYLAPFAMCAVRHDCTLEPKRFFSSWHSSVVTIEFPPNVLIFERREGKMFRSEISIESFFNMVELGGNCIKNIELLPEIIHS